MLQPDKKTTMKIKTIKKNSIDKIKTVYILAMNDGLSNKKIGNDIFNIYDAM